MVAEISNAPKTNIASFNGKYKSGAPALYEIIKYDNLTLRIGLGSGKPVHPFFIPLLQAGTVIYSQDDSEGLLTGADVVLCYTASHAGLQTQLKLIERAAALGVKLFVTCEFALDNDKVSESNPEFGKQPLIALRREAIELCEKLGIGYLKVLCGLIPENILVDGQQHPYIPEVSSWNWKLAEKKVTIYGTGDVPSTWTPMKYMAETFGKLLATKTPSELAALKEIRLSGYTATQNEVIKKYEEETGVKLDVTYIPIEEVEKREKALFEANEGQGVINYWTEYPEFIQIEIAKGAGLLEGPFTTVEGVELPSWKEVFEGLPTTV
ncbi:hypothetical protein IAT38_008453 [Cryptococcus sp. DSM 104549]